MCYRCRVCSLQVWCYPVSVVWRDSVELRGKLVEEEILSFQLDLIFNLLSFSTWGDSRRQNRGPAFSAHMTAIEKIAWRICYAKNLIFVSSLYHQVLRSWWKRIWFFILTNHVFIKTEAYMRKHAFSTNNKHLWTNSETRISNYNCLIVMIFNKTSSIWKCRMNIKRIG